MIIMDIIITVNNIVDAVNNNCTNSMNVANNNYIWYSD